MKFSTMPYAEAALVISLLLAPLPAAASFSCNKVVTGGQQFNLEALGGPHSIVTSEVNGDIVHNTTYTIDICAPLNKKNGDKCKQGTQVCAIKRLITSGKEAGVIDKVTPLAGRLLDHGGGDLDPEVYKLDKVDPESGREGLRVILKGGFGLTETHVLRKKQTLIDFVCNKDLDGTEGEYNPEGKHAVRAENDKGDDNENGDEDKDKDEDPLPKEVQLGIDNHPSLVFDSYGPSVNDTDVDILHLTWSSKYSCQSKRDDGSDGSGDEDGDVKKPSSHWGAFTWIVIFVFLGTAAYLIFGSWLNYNRYGARGWDLLPHGDTIRDIPYLLKDWARRVLNTVQGSGSRGGYSAV